MAHLVDERDAVIETRGPRDYRVHLWTNPAVAEQGGCAAFDLLQTDVTAVLAWATAAAEAQSPCVAEVLLKVVHHDTGYLETIELATIVHGERAVPRPRHDSALSSFLIVSSGDLDALDGDASA